MYGLLVRVASGSSVFIRQPGKPGDVSAGFAPAASLRNVVISRPSLELGLPSSMGLLSAMVDKRIVCFARRKAPPTRGGATLVGRSCTANLSHRVSVYARGLGNGSTERNRRWVAVVKGCRRSKLAAGLPPCFTYVSSWWHSHCTPQQQVAESSGRIRVRISSAR